MLCASICYVPGSPKLFDDMVLYLTNKSHEENRFSSGLKLYPKLPLFHYANDAFEWRICLKIFASLGVVESSRTPWSSIVLMESELSCLLGTPIFCMDEGKDKAF